MRIALRIALIVASGIAGAAVPTNHDSIVMLASGVQKLTLIELYTSEGCSSCPPADRWLSALATTDGLWTEFVPAAFHDDYWDDIGWKDNFAKPEFSARQRRYAKEGGARFVYTPGIFRNGSEWHGWRSLNKVATPGISVGELALKIDGDLISAQFNPKLSYDETLTLYVAVLAMGLETHVLAGENSGKTLRHDFVVTHLATRAMLGSDEGYRASVNLPKPSAATMRHAVVAWVSAGSVQTPIQAVGGYLPVP